MTNIAAGASSPRIDLARLERLLDRAVTMLLAVRDMIDRDPDLEPEPEFAFSCVASDGLPGDPEDHEDNGDEEPLLGWTAQGSRLQGQIGSEPVIAGDEEPDDPPELSCGWLESFNQAPGALHQGLRDPARDEGEMDDDGGGDVDDGCSFAKTEQHPTGVLFAFPRRSKRHSIWRQGRS